MGPRGPAGDCDWGDAGTAPTARGAGRAQLQGLQVWTTEWVGFAGVGDQVFCAIRSAQPSLLICDSDISRSACVTEAAGVC